MRTRRNTPHHIGAITTLALCLALVAIASPALRAERPGRGSTAAFEVTFLKMAIDHHFSALRMTELAAGTDEQRDDKISPGEGTSPTPGFAATESRSDSDEIKSMARHANRDQREEILKAQRFLHDWYGISHTPDLMADARADIEMLEARHGSDFDHKFLEVFSRHHYTIVQRSVDCVVGSNLRHDDLKRMCRNMIETQINEIEDMRHMLCRMFRICDFLPFTTPESH